MRDLVSFVIPSHNCAEFIGPAVESVREQTWKELEIIVVNDGSTDSTAQYLDWLVKNEPRARVITNTVKKGRSEARNAGNAAAKGRFIFVLDSDDICFPKRVELCMPLLKKADFVHGGAMRITPLAVQIGPMITEAFSMKHTKADPRKQSFVVHSTVAYSKEFADKYPYSDGDAAKMGIDDWDQQMRAAAGGARFDFTPNYLTYWRDGDGISSTRNEGLVMEAKRKLHPEIFMAPQLVSNP